MSRYETAMPPTPPTADAQAVIREIERIISTIPNNPAQAAVHLNDLRHIWEVAERGWETAMDAAQARGVLTYRAIAEATGINLTTAQGRVRAARRRREAEARATRGKAG